MADTALPISLFPVTTVDKKNEWSSDCYENIKLHCMVMLLNKLVGKVQLNNATNEKKYQQKNYCTTAGV